LEAPEEVRLPGDGETQDAGEMQGQCIVKPYRYLRASFVPVPAEAPDRPFRHVLGAAREDVARIRIATTARAIEMDASGGRFATLLSGDEEITQVETVSPDGEERPRQLRHGGVVPGTSVRCGE
jgi:hypothetical protein